MALTLHARALALLDACAAEGVSLGAEDGRLFTAGPEPSPALAARLAAFCGAHEGREGLASYRALAAVVRAPSRAAQELLGLPVSLAIGLPATFTITFRRGKQTCICTTSRHAHTRATAQGLPTFVLRELEAAARAVELGRAGPADLDKWLEAKARGDWRLTAELAGADLPGVDLEAPVGVSCGELFEALGAELVDVVFEAGAVGPAELGKGAA